MHFITTATCMTQPHLPVKKKAYVDTIQSDHCAGQVSAAILDLVCYTAMTKRWGLLSCAKEQ